MAALLELHTNDPSCSGCHDLMDPLGFGLEAYDGIGAWRSTADGQTLGKTPSGYLFDGVRELSEMLAAESGFGPCVADALFRFALARVPTPLDKPRLEAIEESWLAGEMGFRSLLLEIAISEAFRTVPPVPEEAP